ncbi:Demethoxyubiquinone hydroxylase family protein [Candidatus Bealeia paramacronuclearis]|uniref:3-demethoxyubiquinol 3-hydroxylase n=1 Tax=Candidatus Bealeia paramacronuclearis TaxID=1921001 RepID=A0ABZ2C5F2_9PROT|nr:Demethoxyubiquinone hydroxylase family protein [Candidatus Bealeia paramacronuclearis]
MTLLLTPKDLESIIRVDHAGEYGAKRIYEGQLRVLKNKPSAVVIEEMYAQELAHLETFSQMIPKNRVRPTLLQPLWHWGAYAMGAGTAFLGEKAAMACTAAVEEVIDAHYQEQIKFLGEDQMALKNTLEKFRAEECQHRDIAYDHGAKEAPAYPLLSGVIKGMTRLAIALSKRL